MKRAILAVLAVVFVAACCLPGAVAVPEAAAFESPLFESPLLSVAQAVSPIVLPSPTPKPLPTMPPLGADEQGEVYRLLVFPIQGGEE